MTSGGTGSEGIELTTDLLLSLCYQSYLTKYDLEDMTVGMCLDYIDEYIEMRKPSKEKVRKATQDDFNNF